MAWVVDTSIVLDIHIGDPKFEPSSTACLHAHLADGLVICPITLVEIGPSFSGAVQEARAFLHNILVSDSEAWTSADTELGHRIWHEFQARRRLARLPKRPVADVLIAAFAKRFQGIITRNHADFQVIAPDLNLVVP